MCNNEFLKYRLRFQNNFFDMCEHSVALHSDTCIVHMYSSLISSLVLVMLSSDAHLLHYLSLRCAILMLAFVGGFVDSAGYYKLFGLFTSSATGNLIVACTAIVKDSGGVFARVFVTLAFAVGAMAATSLYIRLKYVKKVNTWTSTIILFMGEVSALLLAFAIGVYLEYTPEQFPSLESWQSILVGSLLGLSMGIHNGVVLAILPDAPATTNATMTIVKTSGFAAYCIEFALIRCGVLSLHPETSQVSIGQRLSENFYSFVDYVVLVVAFVLGALAGAALVLEIQLWCLAVPVVILLLILTDIFIAKRRNTAACTAGSQGRGAWLDVELGLDMECEMTTRAAGVGQTTTVVNHSNSRQDTSQSTANNRAVF